MIPQASAATDAWARLLSICAPSLATHGSPFAQKSWIPFDQIDYMIGGIAFTALYIRLTLPQYLLLFVVWSLLHPLATFIGYMLKLRDSPPGSR